MTEKIEGLEMSKGLWKFVAVVLIALFVVGCTGERRRSRGGGPVVTPDVGLADVGLADADGDDVDRERPEGCDPDNPCDFGVCDPASGECVACLDETHCAPGEQCLEGACVAVTSCVNSLDCVDSMDGPICHSFFEHCVECEFNGDCLDGGECRATRCVDVFACESDRDCTPQGLLCNHDSGECVECVRDTDCASGERCALGECIRADDTCRPVVVEGRIEGSGTYNRQVNAHPLDTIQLRAAVAGASNPRFEWSLVARPQDSRSPLLVSQATATLLLDKLGTYEVEVRASDDDVTVCDTGRITIVANSDSDIHIELTWTVPALDQVSVGTGTDLDLHYRHPEGTWNAAPYSVFWNNRSADWGTSGIPSHVSLVLDDQYGVGPEVLSHDAPLGGHSYDVGVHYYTDHGHGASLATLRVYIDGELRREVANRSLSIRGGFWHVARIDWPSGNVVLVDQTHSTFP